MSGCLGLDKDAKLVSGGAVPEMAKALENLKAILEASGSSVENVVKATIFVEDLGDFANINEEYKKGKMISLIPVFGNVGLFHTLDPLFS